MYFIEYRTESEKQNDYMGTDGFKCIICLPCDRGADWELSSLLLSSITREYMSYTASPGKDQNSKSEVQFLLNVYHFCTTTSQGPSVFTNCSALHSIMKNLRFHLVSLPFRPKNFLQHFL